MEQGARVLQSIVAGGFLALGAVAVRKALRRPNPRLRVLAAALGLLGLLVALSAVVDLAEPDLAFALSRVNIVLLMGSGYALLMLRHRLIPLRRGVPATMALAAAAACSATLVSGASMAGPNSPLQIAAGIALIAIWVACVGEPVVRFWAESRGRPLIQRARLRALSAGYLGVIFVAITAKSSDDHPALLLASQIVVALVLPVLWVALHPPAWLRRTWQSRERVSRAAIDAMVRYVGDEASLADRGISWACAIVGGDRGAVLDADDQILAAVAMSEEEARAIAREAGDEASLIEAGDGAIVVAPIALEAGAGRLIIASGPFSPLFDSYEADEVSTFAATLAIAIDRVRTLERHRSQSEHYAGVVQAMGDLGEGFVVTDGRRLVYANDAYCRLTGYSIEELLALDSLAQLAPPDELARLAERQTSRRNGGPVVEHYDSALIRKDGTRVELEVSMKILGSPGSPSIVCIIRDITDRKRAEEQLRSALNREHQAVERLEALDEMKNAFLSAVSHELRTPLTGVLGFARTLQTLGDTMDPAERVKVIRRLNSNADKLDRLLADLLDLDRLSRGIIEPRRRPVDLGGLVRSVVREFRLSSDRDVFVDVSPVVADVDRPQIERVVENLLTNASRHTADGTPIWVMVQETPEGALIVVEDAGPGVPEHLRREVFEPFRQGPSLRAHSPGVGIGLALVQRFVDLHAGSIEIAERSGGGASFRIHLPRAAGRPAPAKQSRRSVRGATRPARAG